MVVRLHATRLLVAIYHDRRVHDASDVLDDLVDFAEKSVLTEAAAAQTKGFSQGAFDRALHVVGDERSLIDAERHADIERLRSVVAHRDRDARHAMTQE